MRATEIILSSEIACIVQDGFCQKGVSDSRDMYRNARSEITELLFQQVDNLALRKVVHVP